MDITITSTNLKSIDTINKKLNTAALHSTITSSTSEKNVVKANLRVARPES